ncbi:MAG: FxDxF family PEP-CTERM protein [Pseudomonadota bacterium]
MKLISLSTVVTVLFSIGSALASPLDGDDGLLSLGEDGTFGSAVAGAFSDTFEFTLAQDPEVVTIGVLPFQLSNVLNIDNLSISLFEDGNLITSSNAGTLSFGNFEAGSDYEVVVAGVATGTSGGFYSGFYSVSAVPLPAMLPALGLALGGLGVAVKRRRDRKAAA